MTATWNVAEIQLTFGSTKGNGYKRSKYLNLMKETLLFILTILLLLSCKKNEDGIVVDRAVDVFTLMMFSNNNVIINLNQIHFKWFEF